MQTITREESKRLVEGYRGNKIFTVTFIKRSTGETRVMNCRKGVVKHLTGGEIKYDPKQKGLVVVFDMQKKQYRTIALESIQSVSIENVQYEVQ